MAFSNLFFVFAFLPVSLLVYFLVPKKAKNIVLLLCSLVFFAWGTPEYILLMACSILYNYLTGRELTLLLQDGRQRRARLLFTLSIVVNLLLLGFFKYVGFLAETVNAVLGTHWNPGALPMPIGLSFYTFSLLSYLFDIWRGRAPVARNLLDFALYVTFFPKLTSGPIARYADFAGQLRDHPFSWEKFGGGARRFLVGLAKKVLLANTLGVTFYKLFDLPAGELTFVSAWICALSYTLMLYFDFGGYSDMAIGLAGMFGFTIKKNFDYPYLSGSISEFWRRWHISLGAWFREYVYFPLGGSRVAKWKTARNLLIVWLLTGLWHGAGWTFLLWGVYYGVLIVLEKLVLAKPLEKVPSALRHILTVLLVVIGWVFFFSGSAGDAFVRIGRMFGTGGFWDGAAKYALRGAWRILLVGALACLPVGANFGNGLMRRGRRWIPLTAVFFALLLVLCISGMMQDTYSAFLYFQF